MVAGLALTAAAVFGVSILIILWVLGKSSSDVDRAQNAGQTQLVRAILKTYEDGIVSAVADYTSWTELYQYLQGPPNRAWETENLWPYLRQIFGVDDVFIVSRSGRLVHAYRAHGAVIEGDGIVRMLQPLAKSVFAAEDSGHRHGIAGVINLDGVPTVAALSTIRPDDVKTPSQFALVEARELRPAVAAAGGKDYGISGLKISRGGPGLELKDPRGLPSGFTISWMESASGRQLFDSVLPAILVISFIAALAFAGLSFTWWRFLNDLKEGERRVLAAEMETIRAHARAAEETSKSKSAFFANMSHELRTPLNAILGFSEALQSGTFGPMPKGKFSEYIGDIRASGEHLLRLVNDLLQLSKIEADKVEARNEIVSVHDAIADGVRVVRILATKRNIRIELQPDFAVPQVVADSDLLQQILLNLLSNAVKFSHEGGVVAIQSGRDGERCLIQVRDQGCGIPADTLAQLGKPFVQAEDAFARKYQGTGLGLAISFRLAQLMGAILTIDSVEGAGTTATLALRIARSETADICAA